MHEIPPSFPRRMSGRRRSGHHRSVAARTGWRPALLAALLAVAATACEPAPPAAPPAPDTVAVKLAKVETADLPRILRAVGSTRAQEEVTVGAVVAGRAVEVLREVGDRVRPGDPLVQVDDADYVLERDQRRRALAESLARLGLESLPDGEIDVGQLPMVERARLAAENAKSKLERSQKLFDRPTPLISEQDLGDLRTAWEMALNDEKNARIAARAQFAEVRTREAQVEVAEKRLRDVRHVVPGGMRPGAGTGGTPVSDVFVVAERFVATGDYVSVGAPLYRLVDADPLEVRASVPERRMEEIAVGTGARVTLSASPTPVAGKVVRIRPEVDPATRTVQVEIDVPNAELRLAPGAFATVEFDIGIDRGVPLLAESAVRTFAGVRKVFVVTGGKAAERIVTLGRRSGDRVEVTSGLKAGEAYVVAPPAGLYAGVPVTVEGGGAPAAPEKGK